MMNPMMMNQNNGMMNSMGNNMMNQMMMQNIMMNQDNGMMYPINNMMNQMMMQNMMINQLNMMNQDNGIMMNQGMMINALNYNDNMTIKQMGNNNMMMNQENNNIRSPNIDILNNENKLDIYYNENENEYIDSISKNIFSENDDVEKLWEKLISIYSKLEKKLYRSPYPKEIILRESPKETLEYLLKRGVIEDDPHISFYIDFNQKGIHYGWNSTSQIQSYIREKKLTIKDPLISKVSFYVPLRGAGGLVGLEFVNLEGGSKAKILKFSKNAPKWRKVCEGLNLFGKCIYNKCEAFKKEVIYKVGINQKFDFNEQKKEIVCPICNKNFIPKTLGFWKCEYQIKGEKLKDGEYCKVNINGKETKGDDFEYFDADENGTATWSELLVFACYRQKIKYKA